MQSLDLCLRDGSGCGCNLFDLFEGGIVSGHFLLVALAPRKMLLLRDQVGYLFLGQAIPFDHRRIMS